jgi:hypothetical protein
MDGIGIGTVATVVAAALWLIMLGFLVHDRRKRRAAKASRIEPVITVVQDAQASWRDEPDPAEPSHVFVPRSELEVLHSWERRFWEMHAVVERVLVERDEWKALWREQASQHLEGQAMLEHKIVALRQHMLRALATYNHLVVDHKLDVKPIKVPSDLLPLDGPPVGQAARYYERMKELARKAPLEIDALARRDEIAALVAEPVDDPPLGSQPAGEPMSTPAHEDA